MNFLNEYLVAIKRAVVSSDGGCRCCSAAHLPGTLLGSAFAPLQPCAAPSIKELLRLNGVAVQQAVYQRAALQPQQIRAACSSKLPAPWSAVVHSHLTAVCQLSDGQTEAAASSYNSDSGPHLLLVDAINAEPDDLTLAAAFERTMGNARQLADLADKQLADQGAKAGKVGRRVVSVRVLSRSSADV